MDPLRLLEPLPLPNSLLQDRSHHTCDSANSFACNRFSRLQNVETGGSTRPCGAPTGSSATSSLVAGVHVYRALFSESSSRLIFVEIIALRSEAVPVQVAFTFLH